MSPRSHHLANIHLASPNPKDVRRDRCRLDPRMQATAIECGDAPGACFGVHVPHWRGGWLSFPTWGLGFAFVFFPFEAGERGLQLESAPGTWAAMKSPSRGWEKRECSCACERPQPVQTMQH